MISNDTEAKLDLIRRLRVEPGSAEYSRGRDGLSSVRLNLSDQDYAFTIRPSEIPRLLEEFPVLSVQELFE